MKIRSITIGNYKNIAETTINFTGINALLSLNNYGKSNLLEAIHFAFAYLNASPQQRSVLMRERSYIPLVGELIGKNFIFAVECEDLVAGHYSHIRYGFQFQWEASAQAKGKITDETLEMRGSTSTKYTSYLKRKESRYRASKAKQNYRKLHLDDNVLAIDILPALEGVEIAEAIRQLKNINYKRCVQLDLRPAYFKLPVAFKFAADDYSRFEQDIPEAVYWLKQNEPEKYDLLVGLLCDLFPDFDALEVIASDISLPETVKMGEEVPFTLKNTIYSLLIRSEYFKQPLDMQWMSTGTQRVVWLLVTIILSTLQGEHMDQLIGVDEIETSIHPRLVGKLLSAIMEILTGNTLLVTTHSPYLVQYLAPESIYVGVPNEQGVAHFRPFKKAKVKLLQKKVNELGLSVGEYVFDLLSGGEDEIEQLKACLED